MFTIRSFTAFVFAFIILPALAAALFIIDPNYLISDGEGATTARDGDITVNQCNTGAIQCCDQVEAADHHDVIELLALTGAITEGADTLVGMTCSPMTTLATGAGSSCSAEPVCCSNNSFNGVIAIGCTPINIA
ncbi:hypothetical protein M413DRAFT_447084 [Hebeloma cylindrosporum]|uniref:Hydrophobin n=1 Tax=Hebeloma cylindrosporum TaxID=76867 RepID=A0A0C2XPT9_HEBCY|nr:hypothetical protein M413DRAFT_447084 [Hebeloma cylindrosporum h7]